MGREKPVGYEALHHRLRRERGRATEYPCVDCGRPAHHWSHTHGAPGELIVMRQGRPTPYTLDLTAYQPRCRSCHTIHDRGELGGPCGKPGCGERTLVGFDLCYRHPALAKRPRGAGRGASMGPRDADGRVAVAPGRMDRAALTSTMTSKRCNRCQLVKAVAGFATRGQDGVGRADPYRSICLECDRIKSAAYYQRKRAVRRQ